MKIGIGYSVVHASKDDWDRIKSHIGIHNFDDVYVVFDGFKNLENIEPYNLDKCNAIVTEHEVFEHYCNNILLGMFLSDDCDYLMVCHEDMLLQGVTLVNDIKNLISREPNIGIIGGRDGFWPNYFNMHSSSFSKSEAKYWLKTGEYAQVPIVNFGPIIYSRKAIKSIGLLDISYKYAYAEQDLCVRAIQNGFNNYVLGMDILHEKFGSLHKVPKWISPEGAIQIGLDRKLLNTKWGI